MEMSQGTAAPLVARGLLQHEAKLSVLNFSLRKASTYQAPVANKAQLVLCTGLRYALLHIRLQQFHSQLTHMQNRHPFELLCNALLHELVQVSTCNWCQHY